MTLLRRTLVLVAIVGLWLGSRSANQVLAQGSCSNNASDLFADTCAQPRDACLGDAGSSKISCYNNCDTQFGAGTPDDTSCRNTCDSNYNAATSTCNTDYNNCISQRQQSCFSQCNIFCSQTTGSTCCEYVDSSRGCAYSCGCPTPPAAVPKSSMYRNTVDLLFANSFRRSRRWIRADVC